jgi:hypothetical protein
LTDWNPRSGGIARRCQGVKPSLTARTPVNVNTSAIHEGGYPLSYLIYSEAFDALPGPAKDYFYERARKILSGAADITEFRHLSAFPHLRSSLQNRVSRRINRWPAVEKGNSACGDYKRGI